MTRYQTAAQIEKALIYQVATPRYKTYWFEMMADLRSMNEVW